MTKKELLISILIILLAASVFSFVVWYANEGRAERGSPTALPTLAPAILAPQPAQSVIVTSTSTPVGFKVVVPGSLKEPVKLMKGSNAMRVYLEFEAKDTDAVKALFVKGGTYYVTVRK